MTAPPPMPNSARENPGDDAADDDGQREPGDLAQRNAEKHICFGSF